ncbi:hypothetical protein [Brevundimonas sp. TWP3-1-2b1]|uniref:hypothetical protein n=1 Tax=Brevundimonas sp. TWP3-1-2b1 TaxID=2804650 RepID=UPI003CEB7850
MTDLTAPTGVSDRIGELDIIRGFALFGVLWMNVEGMGGFVVPREAVHGLTQFKVLEDVVGFLSVQMMGGPDRLTLPSRKPPTPWPDQATAAAHAASASARKRRRVGLLIKWRWTLKVL